MNTATTAGVWHSVALVFVDSGTSELWHDGVKVATQSDATMTGSGNTMANHSNDDCLGANCSSTEVLASHGGDVSGLGAGSPEATGYFDGAMDEFRVVNTVMSDNYLQTVYKAENDPASFICEGVCLSETLTLTHNTIRTDIVELSESVSLTDSISAEEDSTSTTVTLPESISFADSLSKQADTNLIESISLTDSCLLYTSPSPRD